MKSYNTIARTFGVFFLLAFLSYGFGSGMASSLTDATDALNTIQTHKGQLILAVILMALVHTVVNIGLPVLMVPTLKKYNKVLSYGYLSTGIAATVVLIVGAIFLLLCVPLSAMYQSADAADMQHMETLKTLLTKGNAYAYQIGMAIWGVGGILFSYLLLISKLVPKAFAIWGFLGYLIFIAGTLLELFDVNMGVQLAIPGGLFEITLSVWLIIKGFRIDAQRR